MYSCISKSVERPKVWLKSDKNIEHFALHVLLSPAKWTHHKNIVVQPHFWHVAQQSYRMRYCLSITTVVTRKRHSVTSSVHFLSCYSCSVGSEMLNGRVWLSVVSPNSTNLELIFKMKLYVADCCTNSSYRLEFNKYPSTWKCYFTLVPQYGIRDQKSVVSHWNIYPTLQKVSFYCIVA